MSLLAKQEFAVPRVIARVNHPKNEWMFNETWGVDISVSTPHLITSLVDEAVSVGRLVRLFQLEGGQVRLVEVTLADDAPVVDQAIRDIDVPRDATFVAIVRDEHVVMARGDTVLQAGDEVLALVTPESEDVGAPDADRRLNRHGASDRPDPSSRRPRGILDGPCRSPDAGLARPLVLLAVLRRGSPSPPARGRRRQAPRRPPRPKAAPLDLTAGDVQRRGRRRPRRKLADARPRRDRRHRRQVRRRGDRSTRSTASRSATSRRSSRRRRPPRSQGSTGAAALDEGVPKATGHGQGDDRAAGDPHRARRPTARSTSSASRSTSRAHDDAGGPGHDPPPRRARLTRDAGAWKIIGYDLAVDRDGTGLPTRPTSSTTTTAAMIDALRRHPSSATARRRPARRGARARRRSSRCWLPACAYPASGTRWFTVTKTGERDYTPAPNQPVFFLALGNDGRPATTRPAATPSTSSA